MSENFENPGQRGFTNSLPAFHTPPPFQGRAPAGMAGETSASDVNLSVVFNAVSRWWKVAVPAGLLLALTGAGIVWLVFVPKYQSTALLRIKDENPYIVFDQNEQSKKFVATQVHLMTRRTILSDALKGLEGIPELAKQNDPIEWLQNELIVTPVGTSELFEVTYQGRTPEVAKTIVDAVVQTYLDYAEMQSDSDTKRVIELLEEERTGRKRIVDRLREKVRDKTKELTGRDPFNPTNAKTTVSIQSPLATLLNRRINTEVELAVLEARLQAYEEKPIEQLAPSELTIRQAVEADPEMVRLRAAITQTRSKIHQYRENIRDAEQSATYKRYQKELQGYETTLDRLRGDLIEAARKGTIAQAEYAREQRLKEMRGAIERYQLTTQLLQDRFEKQTKELEQSGGDSLDLEFFRTELAREERVFELISDRTLALKTELAAPGRVKLLDEANLPVQPVHWAPWTPLSVVVLVGLFAPMAFAILWERNAKRVGDSSTLKSSDLTVLAEIAALPVASRGARRFAGSDRSWRELSLFEESIDSLRTGLRLSRQAKDLHVLAVTSAVSREGKTSLVCQLAVSIARASCERILLVDADMRAPNVHEVFGIPNESGVADILANECNIDDAINTEYSELLHLLPAGDLKASPHSLVGDDSFSNMISKLREKYPFILIDTPPILSAGESLVLSVAADATMLCAMRNYSRAEQVREAYNRLTRADANPIGVVLNGVPTHRYSYSYGCYRYGRYAYSR